MHGLKGGTGGGHSGGRKDKVYGSPSAMRWGAYATPHNRAGRILAELRAVWTNGDRRLRRIAALHSMQTVASGCHSAWQTVPSVVTSSCARENWRCFSGDFHGRKAKQIVLLSIQSQAPPPPPPPPPRGCRNLSNQKIVVRRVGDLRRAGRGDLEPPSQRGWEMGSAVWGSGDEPFLGSFFDPNGVTCLNAPMPKTPVTGAPEMIRT